MEIAVPPHGAARLGIARGPAPAAAVTPLESEPKTSPRTASRAFGLLVIGLLAGVLILASSVEFVGN